jgi:hypothetical protein
VREARRAGMGKAARVEVGWGWAVVVTFSARLMVEVL